MPSSDTDPFHRTVEQHSLLNGFSNESMDLFTQHCIDFVQKDTSNYSLKTSLSPKTCALVQGGGDSPDPPSSSIVISFCLAERCQSLL